MRINGVFSKILIRLSATKLSRQKLMEITHSLGWVEPKPQIMINVGKDVKKSELFYRAGKNGKWCSPYGKQSDSSANE